jgi:hypothetical protein
MTDTLHGRDILAWSERQAAALREIAEQERHDDVDWPRVIEEIIAVGQAQLNDVRGLLRQAMFCLLRIHLRGDDAARGDWVVELACLLDDAADQCTPSMTHRIGLELIWNRTSARMIRDAPDDPRARALPDHCPWTLEQLLGHDRDGLLAAMAGWP